MFFNQENQNYFGNYYNIFLIVAITMFWLTIYYLFKKVLFKKTNWKLLKHLEGLLGFLLITVQTFILFKHFFRAEYFILNPEHYVIPDTPLIKVLRVSGIFILPWLSKILYMIKGFKHIANRRLARLIILSAPVFLAYLSITGSVKKIPSDDLYPMWFWVALVAIDLYVAFFSKKWPRKYAALPEIPPPITGFFRWFKWTKQLKRLGIKIKYFCLKIRLYGKPILFLAMLVSYYNIMYSDSASVKSNAGSPPQVDKVTKVYWTYGSRGNRYKPPERHENTSMHSQPGRKASPPAPSISRRSF